MPRPVIAGIIASVALIAWGSFTLLKKSPQPPKPDRPPIRQSGAFSESELPPLLGLTPGTTLRYRLKREIAFSGIQGMESPIRYGGILTFTSVANPAAKKSTTLMLRGHFSHHPEQNPMFLLAEIAPKGLIKHIEASPTTRDDHQQLDILRDALALWSFFDTSDTSGHYEASFRQEPAKGQNLPFTKIKSRYLTAPMNSARILNSQHALIWNSSLHIPERIEGSETVALSGVSKEAKFQSHYEIALVGTPEKSDAISKSLLNTEISSLALYPNQERPETAGPTLSWTDALKQLDLLNTLDTYSRHALLGDLIKHVKNSKDHLTELAKLAQKEIGPESSETFKWAAGILASAGTRASQQALVDLYKSASGHPEIEQDILNALTVSDAPLIQPATELIKKEFRQDNTTSQGAAYALGSALNKNPNDVEAVRLLLDAWKRAQSDSERGILIDAMGNSGNRQFIPMIEESLKSTRPVSLRAKAGFATRYMPLDDAKPLIVMALTDSAPTVRTGAVDSIRFHSAPATFQSELSHCAQDDPVESLRRECKELLR